jgi:hypothetical protein
MSHDHDPPVSRKCSEHRVQGGMLIKISNLRFSLSQDAKAKLNALKGVVLMTMIAVITNGLSDVCAELGQSLEKMQKKSFVNMT